MTGSRFATVKAAVANKVNTCESASMGRLFDAVSAILKIRTENTYEGECAIALENTAAAAQSAGELPYPLEFEIQNAGCELILNQVNLIKELYSAAQSGAGTGRLALGFHLAVAYAVLAVCRRVREQSGENTVALSGGVFANQILTKECVRLLERDGFRVCLNEAVPCNDSGISLGQSWLCE